MSLVELMMASGLLLGSSAASLGVWNRVSTTLMEHRVEQEQLESLEAEVQALEARLRDPRQDPLGQQHTCEEQMQRLVARLENQPPRSGVVRTLEVPAAGEFFMIHLRAGVQERRRLYSPAAFGGCGGDPAGFQAETPAEGGGHGPI